MKARITHLKAPWPSGAVVGAIVAFAAGAIPAWAAGKCVPVVDEEEAEYLVEPVPHVSADGSGQALPLAESINAEFAELRAKLEASEANAAALQAKLDAAETDDGKAAAALKEADAQADAERTAAESKAGKGKK